MPYFYFSRYHITTAGDTIDKAKFFYDLLDKELEVEYRKDKYKFVNADTVKVNSKLYVTGKIAKYKIETEEQVINQITKEPESLPVINKILDSVLFIIDPESSIIIYEESKTHIPKNSFAKRFIELVKQKYNESFSDLVISPITVQYTFMEKLKSIKFIKKIVIDLVPSNPNNSHLWENVDEELQKHNITNYREVQENKKSDEGIILSPETESKLYMSIDGYGKNFAVGVDDNNKPIQISTRDVDELEKEHISYQDKTLQELIEEVQSKLNEIIKRTNSKH